MNHIMSKTKKSDNAAFTLTSDKNEDDHKAIEALRASFARLNAGIDIFSQKDFLIQDPNAIENAEGTGMPSWSVDQVPRASLQSFRDFSSLRCLNPVQSRLISKSTLIV